MKSTLENTISRAEAEAAIKTIFRWIGEDPEREGLKNTPKRVIDSLNEFFQGYKVDPKEVLTTTFEEIGGYADMILLKDIKVESHCEHHLVPITGRAHVAYIPDGRVVGISKLARVVEVFSKRMQIQERLTSEIANAIFGALKPKGVVVAIEAAHACMSTRGVRHNETSMYTQTMLGCFENDMNLKQQFFSCIKS